MTAQAQGKWDITLKMPGGGDKRGQLELRVDGAALSGRISNADYAVDFSGGTVDGNRLEWSAKLEKPMRLNFKFTATVDGDRIEGKANHLLGSATFSGTRARG